MKSILIAVGGVIYMYLFPISEGCLYLMIDI